MSVVEELTILPKNDARQKPKGRVCPKSNMLDINEEKELEYQNKIKREEEDGELNNVDQ